MSISFKPTIKDKRAIRNIIVDAWLDENQVQDIPDKVLQHIIEYCWDAFTASNRYAVAAQYWRGQTHLTVNISASSSATTKPLNKPRTPPNNSTGTLGYNNNGKHGYSQSTTAPCPSFSPNKKLC